MAGCWRYLQIHNENQHQIPSKLNFQQRFHKPLCIAYPNLLLDKGQTGLTFQSLTGLAFYSFLLEFGLKHPCVCVIHTWGNTEGTVKTQTDNLINCKWITAKANCLNNAVNIECVLVSRMEYIEVNDLTGMSFPISTCILRPFNIRLQWLRPNLAVIGSLLNNVDVKGRSVFLFEVLQMYYQFTSSST